MLRDRYVRYLDRSIDLAAREMERNRDDEPLRRLSEFYHANFSDCRFRFLECAGDLLGEFRKLRDEGCLEIMATAATHGLLPLPLEALALAGFGALFLYLARLSLAHLEGLSKREGRLTQRWQ